MITQRDIDNWFSYHPPSEDQQVKYLAIRNEARNLATLICNLCPESADTTAAIRKLREVVMTANAAIACNE